MEAEKTRKVQLLVWLSWGAFIGANLIFLGIGHVIPAASSDATFPALCAIFFRLCALHTDRRQN